MGKRKPKQLKKMAPVREELVEAAEEVARRNTRASQIGAPIPGSRLVRDFCAYCGEAIRVVDVGSKNFCLGCTNSHNDFGGGLDKTAEHDIQYHGDQFHSGEW